MAGWAGKCVYCPTFTKLKRMTKMAIEKCMTERSFMVEHDNARSEGTRKGWVGNENERCSAIAFF
jgi:hypothetical protein